LEDLVTPLTLADTGQVVFSDSAEEPHFLFAIDVNRTTGFKYKVAVRQIVAEFFTQLTKKQPLLALKQGSERGCSHLKSEQI
jgi:hypothetical protein